jgi:hypothetical protein
VPEWASRLISEAMTPSRSRLAVDQSVITSNTSPIPYLICITSLIMDRRYGDGGHVLCAALATMGGLGLRLAV